jgi:hypothetical protein
VKILEEILVSPKKSIGQDTAIDGLGSCAADYNIKTQKHFKQ